MRALKRRLDPVTRVRIVRNGRVEELDSDLLVPGDVLELESTSCAASSVTQIHMERDKEKYDEESESAGGRSSGWKIPCDAVLISGSCIVNESILTGEWGVFKLKFVRFIQRIVSELY